MARIRMTAADFAAILDAPDARVPGWCTPDKAAHLYDLAASLAWGVGRSPVGVEIGVWGGRSLLPVAMAFRDCDRGFVVGIDPYAADAATENERDPKNVAWWGERDYDRRHADCLALIVAHGLSRHCGLLRARSEDVAGLFGQLDYLHIDGNHSSPCATRDVSLYLPLVRAGGFVVLDDANWGSVRPARALVATECRLVHAGELNGKPGAWEVWQR